MLKIILSILVLAGCVFRLAKVVPTLSREDFLLGLKVLASGVAAIAFIFIIVQLF